MKKFLITLLLALAVCAGAVELYWDDGTFAWGTVQPYHPAVGVCFNADEGPGGTGGQTGTVYAFRAYYKVLGDDPADLYLYTVEYYFGKPIPDEPLYDYPLDNEQDEDGDWTVYTLIESKRVPEEFFAVIVLPSNTEIYKTDEYRETSHSAAIYPDYGGVWLPHAHDIRLRVEWEPEETVVKETSWGAIKATY